MTKIFPILLMVFVFSLNISKADEITDVEWLQAAAIRWGSVIFKLF